jgi:hypothetical protein
MAPTQMKEFYQPDNLERKLLSAHHMQRRHGAGCSYAEATLTRWSE